MTACPAVAEHHSRGTEYRCEYEAHPDTTVHESHFRNGKPVRWTDDLSGTGRVVIASRGGNRNKETH